MIVTTTLILVILGGFLTMSFTPADRRAFWIGFACVIVSALILACM